MITPRPTSSLLSLPVLPDLPVPALTLHAYARLAGLTMAEVLEECARGRLVVALLAGRRHIVAVRG